MSDLTPDTGGLRNVGALSGLRHVRTPRPRELHATADSDRMPAITSSLRTDFGAELVLMAGEDRRSVDGLFRVHYVFANGAENWFAHVTTTVDGRDPVMASSAMSCYPASRFEREIRDQMGIRVIDHPDPRPLVRHGFWPENYFPLRKDAGAPAFRDDGRPFPFGEVAGEGVYEIPVGPVHAGVIEPGHFRFSAMGETIIDVKQRLFFTHKGTEKLFEGRLPAEGVALAERVSGDSSVAHSLAYCEALERLACCDVPRRAAHVRAVLLELERIYNHVADVGMIVSDTGFAVAQSQCYRIRERLFRLNQAVTGHRQLRGIVVPGGVADVRTDLMGVHTDVADAVRDFIEVVGLCLENSLVADRLDRTGVLQEPIARDHAVRGYVARASGLDIDARRDHPRPPYDRVAVSVPVLQSGDVRARLLVRVAEVKESARLIAVIADSLPDGPSRVALGPLPAFEPAFALVEGWRGCVVHWVMADAAGLLHRVKIVDPSFLNWPALSRALVDNIVPDFPLCNKSFNLSYSGNDL